MKLDKEAYIFQPHFFNQKGKTMSTYKILFILQVIVGGAIGNTLARAYTGDNLYELITLFSLIILLLILSLLLGRLSR